MSMKQMQQFLLVLALVVLTLWFCIKMFSEGPGPRPWTPAEKKWVVERMKKHGIDAALQDDRGYFFMRNGKRCAL